MSHTVPSGLGQGSYQCERDVRRVKDPEEFSTRTGVRVLACHGRSSNLKEVPEVCVVCGLKVATRTAVQPTPWRAAVVHQAGADDDEMDWLPL